MKISKRCFDFVLTPETKLDREFFERLNSSVNALKKQYEELQAILRNVNRAVGWTVPKSEEQEAKADQAPIWVIEVKKDGNWTVFSDYFYWTRNEAREEAKTISPKGSLEGVTGVRVSRYRRG